MVAPEVSELAARRAIALALLRSVISHGRGYPFATFLSLIAIPDGLLALTIGPDISRGFSAVFHRPWPVYVWGVFLLLGGCLVAAGIARGQRDWERTGLYVLCPTYLFYGAFVIIGLHQGGLVTGPHFLALAVACALRARVVLVEDKILRLAVKMAPEPEIPAAKLALLTGVLAPTPPLPAAQIIELADALTSSPPPPGDGSVIEPPPERGRHAESG